MGVKISDKTLAEVRDASEIVEVIGEYVQLKKNGRQYGGLCPFHDEKTPSFSVSEEKQVYHCFGCGAGGNVFTFLQELKGWSFMQTVSHLAERAKMTLPDVIDDTPQEDRQSVQLNEMKKGHELAASTFHNILLLTEEGAPGRVYAGERLFTQEQIEHFRIGYALDGWETLSHIFANNGYDLAVMEECGLLAERKSGGYYDLFRNRLMFPIADSNGTVVAFGGRIIGEGQPKYLNSPETPIFQKAKTLFHMDQARSSIRKQNKVFLFEGAVDVMAAWKAEIPNAVATLGTALSQDHAKLIRRNAEEVIVCYDGDKAGRQAITKTIPVLERAGCRIQICLLPDGYDPDDYVKEFGEHAFKKFVEQDLLSVMSFKMLDAKQMKNMKNEGERLQYVEEMLTEIAHLQQSVEQEHFLRQLSNEFELSFDVLHQEMKRKQQTVKKQAWLDSSSSKRAAASRSYQHPSRQLAAHVKAEHYLLAHMLQDNDVIWRVAENLKNGFNIEEHQALYAYLMSFVSQNPEKGMREFVEGIEDQQLAKLAASFLMYPIKAECTDKELFDYIKRIEQYPQLLRIQEQQQSARLEEDPIRAAEKQMELIRLKREVLGK